MNADSITILDLDSGEQSDLNVMLAQLRSKQRRNLLRAGYYDLKNVSRDLGVKMPPHLRRQEFVLGWAAKAVDVLNRRCVLEGFAVPGVDLASAGMDQIWQDNRLESEIPQAGVSSLIHSVAFNIITQGDVQSGEPEVLWMVKDALSGTGIWDSRRRSLRAFLSIIEADKNGNPTEFVIYRPGVNTTVTKSAGKWTVERRPHAYGLPVEPIPYRPRLGRPFGSSRISRAVMSLQNTAIRATMRTEVTAERYSMAQRVLLGADESVFKTPDGATKPAWLAAMDAVWAIPDDTDATDPALARADVKEFTAGSQKPHSDQLYTTAQLFSGETSIPISSLGFATQANPASAEAYRASRDDLISEAEGTTRDWAPGQRRSALQALQMLNGWDEIPDEFRRLSAKWRNPATPSRAAAADAAVKLVSQGILPADSDVTLEQIGFDEPTIRRIQADRRKSIGRAVLERLPVQDAPDGPVA